MHFCQNQTETGNQKRKQKFTSGNNSCHVSYESFVTVLQLPPSKQEVGTCDYTAATNLNDQWETYNQYQKGYNLKDQQSTKSNVAF